MNLFGYLRKYPNKLVGERGQYYTYIVAANGVFVEANGPLISARVPIADCPIRGLAPAESMVKLTYGSIPQRFWDLALDAFMAQPDKERYVAITGAGGYHLSVPDQAASREDLDLGGSEGHGSGSSVAYLNPDNVVLDLHSHPDMEARFSTQDNIDEVGLRLYGVVGRLDAAPVVKLRVGVFGYFMSLSWNQVFDGSLAGAAEQETEEVKEECDVHRSPKEHGRQLEYFSGWLRRNWFNS